MTANDQNTQVRCGVGGLLIFCWFLAFAAQASSSHGVMQSSNATPIKDASVSKTEAPTQPVPFSHKKHLALGLQCKQCHPNPEPGDRMTLPASAKCMACHDTIAKEKAGIQKLAELSKSGSAIPWVRVYVLPGWVYWNHRAHLEAQMTCEVCHGQVAKMEVMTKATNVTTMAGCVECHRKNDASTGCKYCHADK
jgi:hypothetical protein